MARRTFTVIDITEIYVHWYAGRSKSELAASLGVDRKTVGKYLRPAELAGLTPGGPPMTFSLGNIAVVTPLTRWGLSSRRCRRS
jgi:hypothetical protein